MGRCRAFVLSLLPWFSLWGATILPETGELPWFTGTLLAPSGTVTPVGHCVVQAYLVDLVTNGIYDSDWEASSLPDFHTVLAQLYVKTGLFEKVDILFFPQLLYNYTEGESEVLPGDLITGIGFEIIHPKRYPRMPGLKLTIREFFPTGKYQQLRAEKLGTDIGGRGSFITNPHLVAYKIYHLYDIHYLSMTCGLGYGFPAPVHVRGLNVYGGADNTDGRVYPGAFFTAIASFEYNLGVHWALAFDSLYVHVNRTRFVGDAGTIDGFPARVGGPSSESISFAPALEYNFSDHFGILLGSWFTSFGRNASRFYTVELSLAYNY